MKEKKKLLNGIFLIFGTTVGAGMLGIPTMTAGVGCVPAFVVTLLVWLFMVATGLLLIEATMKMPEGANLVSLAGRFLGKKVKWVATLLFLLFYGCLLVAYFSGGAPLLGEVGSFVGLTIPPFVGKVAFAIIFGSLIFLGTHWIGRINFVLSIGMLVAYAILMVWGSKGVDTSRFGTMNISLTLLAIPILFSSFGYHNIIPSLVHHLGKKNKKTLQLSVIFGTFLAFIIYVLWQWLILGSVSLEEIEQVKRQGLPVTYALQEAVGHSSIYVVGQVFAFFALTTSFLGVGLSFVDFMQDGFREHKKDIARGVCAGLTVVVPFLCVLSIPALFEKALGVAGGFGVPILNGILPVLLFARVASTEWKTRSFEALLIILSLLVVMIEIRVLLS